MHIRLLALLLGFFFLQGQAHSVPIVDIKNFDERLYAEKLTHENERSLRVVYKDGDTFVKIWGKNYISSAKFLHALHVGFYDRENTPLIALIYEQDNCRGYVTRSGTQLDNLTDIDGILYPINEQKDRRYSAFYYDLLERSRRTRLVYPDLTIRNLVLEGGKIKIIDLEWVVPADLVRKSYFKNSSFPKEYRTFIKKMRTHRNWQLEEDASDNESLVFETE